jgi:hypothetical protein
VKDIADSRFPAPQKTSRQDIKKGVTKISNALILINNNHYFLCLGSEETVNL